MKTELIDQLTKTQEELKSALHTHGIHRIFEQRGKLIIQESDEVQVKVIYQDGKNIVKPKSTQIDNTFLIRSSYSTWARCSICNVLL